MKPESGNRVMLTHHRERGYVLVCSWSADGSRIYYDRWYDQPKGVFSVPPLGGDEQLVLEDAMQPEALPDGSLLLVQINPEHRYQMFRYWPDAGKLQGYAIEVPFVYSPVRAGPGGRQAWCSEPGWGRARQQELMCTWSIWRPETCVSEESPGQFSDAFSVGAFTRDGKYALTASPRGSLYRVAATPLDGRALGPPPSRTLLANPDTSGLFARYRPRWQHLSRSDRPSRGSGALLPKRQPRRKDRHGPWYPCR
jgi:eukaryotic-like serine/threonine-protein kinase